MQHPSRSTRGFTLAELLVVMVILALLASLVFPQLFGKLESAEIKTAMVQLALVETALDNFRLDVHRYPTQAEGLKVLWEDPGNLERWKGPYLKKPLKEDPWGHPYVYKVPGPKKRPYDLLSLGLDGEPGGEDVNADISVWD